MSNYSLAAGSMYEAPILSSSSTSSSSSSASTAQPHANRNFHPLPLKNYLPQQSSIESIESAQSPTISSQANVLYKGWLLTLQDTAPNPTSSSGAQLKWVPKFAVVYKQEKCVLLHDYEPNIPFNFNSNQTGQNLNQQQQQKNFKHFRLDNLIKKDSFVNYWRNRSEKFDVQLSAGCSRSNEEFLKLTTPMYNNAEGLDKESINSFAINSIPNDTESINTNLLHSVTSGNATFRLAGLFFKKDKTEKAKHSSLKRAKSGIQLERKKPVVNVNNTIISSESKSANLSVNSPENEFENKTRSKFFNLKRLSLPSPMRPSRSHESLSSPLKSSMTSNQLQTDAASNNNNNNNKSLKPKSIKQGTSQIENIIKLSLNGSLNESLASSLQSPLLSPTNTNKPQQQTILINSIHTSLLNEENCFEIKCSNSTISLFNQSLLSSENLAAAAAVDELAESSPSDDCLDECENTNNLELHIEEDENREDLHDFSTLNNNCNNKRNSLFRKSNLSNKFRSKKETQTTQNQQQQQQQPQVKCYNSTTIYCSRYFMCRRSEEREKWIQCLRDVARPNLVDERHEENSLQVWLLEAKGQPISAKTTKKYFCEVYLNDVLHAKTCCKEKKDILFWGENFDFSVVNCEYLRVLLYQETVENSKKKAKKDKEYSSFVGSREKDSNNNINLPSKSILLGYVNIPVNTIESNQPVEKWYKLEPPSSAGSQGVNEALSSTTQTSHSGSGSGAVGNGVNGVGQEPNSGSSSSSASLTTTQNFSKDSISIRIKAKYQCVDILPLHCYNRLIDFIRDKYLDLMITLEPHLNVRVKDDLANSLVRIAHKLQIQTKFLSDLVLQLEVLHSEDNSLTFRGNSLATKAMESYMKLVGENYLKQTLSDCVRSIIDTTHDLEIDPSKVSNPSSLQANREELVQILHLVCGRVFNSCVNFPSEMKNVFARLRSECKRHGKTDEMCDTLISASIFLRFICPAILSPNLFNLTQEYPQEKAARKLTLAAKTLQTIANFSKFGGKEFYMSFEKMNQFVTEHTILMREFLRNISTEETSATPTSTAPTATSSSSSSSSNDLNHLEANECKQMFNKTVLPIVTLTPQTPNMPPKHARGQNTQIPNYIIMNEYENTRRHKDEVKYELELIDLGKQLSILHSLLGSIISTLDQTTKSKISDELTSILSEITNLKNNPMLLNNALNNNNNNNNSSNNNKLNNPAKLFSYENRLHQAIIKNQHQQLQQQQQQQPISSLTSPSTPSEANEAPKSAAYSNCSSATSSRYSSQTGLNILNTNTTLTNMSSTNSDETLNAKIVETNLSKQKLESEIFLLKQKLRDTELTLKQEQAEKHLIEFKLKQQQKDNDQQMKNIINRLLKVEEELRKEQSEMHKLLKAKQDLIEIQKKRIEYLTNRTNTANSPQVISRKSANHASTSVQNGGTVLPMTTNYPLKSYDQHSIQTKIRQVNKQQQPQQQTGGNFVEQTVNKINSEAQKNYLAANSSLSLPQSSKTYKIGDLLASQIAASPSSSSSSMTQFCNYLAVNTIATNNVETNEPNNNNKLNFNLMSKMLKLNEETLINSGSVAVQNYIDASSSNSSSSTALSTSSSLNHLNTNQTNFLRTSEL